MASRDAGATIEDASTGVILGVSVGTVRCWRAFVIAVS